VWLYITSLAVGGAEQSLVALANNLDRSRYDVTIWTTFNQNPLADQVADDVPVRTLNIDGVVVGEEMATVERAENPLDYVRAPARFARAIRAERPDIVQSYLVYDNTVARIAGLLSATRRSLPERGASGISPVYHCRHSTEGSSRFRTTSPRTLERVQSSTWRRGWIPRE